VKTLVTSLFEWFGALAFFTADLARAAVKPPYEWRESIRQMDEVGSKSLPLVALAGAAMGVALSMHTRDSLIRFGAQALQPAVIIMSITQETGPIITALVASGRVAAGIGAELGAKDVIRRCDPRNANGSRRL
jgi:phospholipid/cholesterol/gamma-HCH transport system permease protein